MLQLKVGWKTGARNMHMDLGRLCREGGSCGVKSHVQFCVAFPSGTVKGGFTVVGFGSGIRQTA